MQEADREALAALRLTWAPTSDDLWRPQSVTHVTGLNEPAADDVMEAFGDALRDPDSAPLGVAIRGQAGSGKTHLLGQIRERVQNDGGFFFVVELLDAASFWESVRSGILESLGRPGVGRETQLKDLLWELSSIAHVSRAERRAIIGDDDLEPDTLDRFVDTLAKARRDVRDCHQTLRALVLLAATDLTARDIGDAYLQASDEDDGAEDRRMWRLKGTSPSAQQCVRDIARLTALAGPAVLALDQIDTLLAQSSTRTGDAAQSSDGVLEQVAHGLMTVRQTMRRTVAVVACLPSAWEAIRDRATASVSDRFRVTTPLAPLPNGDLGRAILERRFAAGYSSVGFTPPYPSWPILASAFDDAAGYTPRQLLIRADAHVRELLRRGAITELAHLSDLVAPMPEPAKEIHDTAPLDQKFVAYRARAVPAAALDPDGEDTAVPALLHATLTAWAVEQDDDQSYICDPPPGAHVMLHARLRRTLDSATDDEQHWAFRAIGSTNAVAAQNRIKKAVSATGLGAGGDRRRLFLLRNTAWPSGPKTAAAVADFERAGGRTLALSDDDLRTMAALQDLIQEDDAGLAAWLRVRRPAHSITVLREALGGDEPASAPIDVEPTPQPENTTAMATSDEQIPLGVDVRTDATLSVELAALRKHVAIFAGSGSGKTVLIRRLVEEAALRGVSSIVLDPNNDLSRLGSSWPERPAGWHPADDQRAHDYFTNTEVLIWTPRRSTGRPLAFQPLPDFASVRDDHDEYHDAVEAACAALEPRAQIAGSTAKAARSRAVLREALLDYGRQPVPTLSGFIDMLEDLPDDVSGLAGAEKMASEIAQNLRAAMVNDPMFGGAGQPVDPGVLLTPSRGYRARVSVISMIGLQSDEQRQGFVSQLQMALFAWIKRHPAADRPLGGLLVMDEAQTLAPAKGVTASLRSTLALASQARKYGLGLIFATQAPKSLHNQIPGNATTQFYGLLNSPAQIDTATEMARAKGGLVPDISRLRAGNFYVATEGEAFHRIAAPWCLSYHPSSPPSAEQVLGLAQRR
ncbi:DUF87 domain-containing protein [Mycolicibacterium sp. 120266]|uniref:helicase HerA domain-containing protein n=1 Tax=Mycolicibacterium sp. 120266 TaxID=3090601 RepID=UPI00299ED3FA|nr:DUF87 domain-containing protein [Mycolicibacterium sp. 120266]MDX1874546.1 DUF87 domain-containing protein [Mycolicibacterium sp. 120266]